MSEKEVTENSYKIYSGYCPSCINRLVFKDNTKENKCNKCFNIFNVKEVIKTAVLLETVSTKIDPVKKQLSFSNCFRLGKVTKPLKFSEAMIALKESKHVKRLTWSDTNKLKMIVDLMGVNRFLLVNIETNAFIPWSANAEDCLAEDWIIVK